MTPKIKGKAAPKAKVEPLPISFSELDAFRRCRVKWHAGYYLGLRPQIVSRNLVVGTAWHTIMEAHYDHQIAAETRSVGRVDDAVDALTKLAQTNTVTIDEYDMLAWMYDGYVAKYKADLDWEIEETEGWREVLLDDGAFNLRLRFDLMVRDKIKGNRYIVDFKTMKGKDASGSAYQNDLALEVQFPLYVAVMNLLDEDVFGAVYAAARKDRLKRGMTLDERFCRKPEFFTDAFQQSVINDAVMTAREIKRVREALATGDTTMLYSNPIQDQCKFRCDVMEPHMLSMRTGRSLEDIALNDYGFTSRAGRAAAKAEAEAANPEVVIEEDATVQAVEVIESVANVDDF